MVFQKFHPLYSWELLGDSLCALVSAKLLQTQQNTALRIVLHAFCQCKIALLHTEAYIPHLHLWLNRRIMLFYARIAKSGICALIQGACYDIQMASCKLNNLRLRLLLMPVLMPSFEWYIWAFNWLGDCSRTGKERSDC